MNLPPPSVAINQATGQADPTNASPINFTAVFSEAVNGFTSSGVTITGTAPGTKTATVTGTGSTYNVAVTGMTAGMGTVIAIIPANVATGITSGGGNLASTSTKNTVTFDNVPPTVMINQAATQADPTGASPINFTVVFSKPVTGFSGSGVTLSGTAGATTATVTGGPVTYNVAVSGMTGDGTVIATIGAGVATDSAGNGNAASTSSDNQVLFATPPAVTINRAAGQPNPAHASPVNFTVVFNKAVTGFSGSGVTLSGTAGATTATVTGGPTTYNAAVSGMTTAGTVIASVGPNVATSAAGLGNLASTSTDNTISFNPPQGSISADSGSAGPGATVAIPITLALNSGVTLDSLSFGLQITANGGAPALTGTLSFSPAAGIPAPTLTDTSAGSNTISSSWLSGLSLSGASTNLGTVGVIVPTSASNGQTYTIHVTAASATSGGTTDVPLGTGADAPLTVSAPPYLVGDAFPAGADTAGGFGDGILNNLDLIYALRAVTKVPGFTPLACSERFDAMDSFPLDTDTVRGGDGQLNNLDLIRTLRRVTKIDTSLPVRSSRGLACAAAAQQFALQGQRGEGSPAAEPVSGALEFGEAEVVAGSVRVPVYLRAAEDLALEELSLSLGVTPTVSNTVSQAVSQPLRFLAGEAPLPTIIDSGVPGVLAVAWFESGLYAVAGQEKLLGYVDMPGTDPAALPLQLYGVEANAVGDRHSVRMSLQGSGFPGSASQ